MDMRFVPNIWCACQTLNNSKLKVMIYDKYEDNGGHSYIANRERIHEVEILILNSEHFSSN